MQVRYKNNMTRREFIGQKRLIFTTKPALLKKDYCTIFVQQSLSALVFAALFQIHGSGGEGEVHAVLLHHVHQVKI